jgi:hypothetical protein
VTFPDLPCPHCGQLVKLVRQVGRPAFVDLPKVVKPADRRPASLPPPPPWKEPLKSFTEALNVGIREAVAESGRLTLEAIRALPQPPATVVNYTPPPTTVPAAGSSPAGGRPRRRGRTRRRRWTEKEIVAMIAAGVFD